jgi:menaquinol-cytochrome c reductase iron-sulfur subunit
MMRTLTRRQMIIATGAGAAGIAALLTVPAVGFVLSPLFQKTRISFIRVGPIDNIPLGTPTPLTVPVPSGEAYDTTPVNRIVYVVRKRGGDTLALTNVCTHMQCDVHWDPSRQQFLCPCHGGLYDRDGINVGGPPPSPLPEWVHTVVQENGEMVLYIANQYTEKI